MLGEKSKMRTPSIYLKYYFKDLFNATAALTIKNFLIFSRNRYLTSLLILCPFFICIFLQQIQDQVDAFSLKTENKSPNEIEISKIHKCTDYNCITLGIGLTSGNTE